MRSIWDQYTMKFDLKRSLEEEEESEKIFQKFTACTPDGVLVQTFSDEDGHNHLIFFNLITRCEIARQPLPCRTHVLELRAVDDEEIFVVGEDVKGLLGDAPKRLFTTIFKSYDRWKSIVITEATLLPTPSPVPASFNNSTALSNAFVFAIRNKAKGDKFTFFHASYRDISRAFAHTNRKVIMTEIGSATVQGPARISMIPYDSTSFALLHSNRIDVFDTASNELSRLRSIPVDWTFSTAFPSHIVIPLPFDGTQSVMMQTVLGEKLKLNVETGEVTEISPFIRNSDETSIIIQDHVLGGMSKRERAALGVDVESDGEEWDDMYDMEDDAEFAVKDSVYLTPGHLVVEGSIMGHFATHLMKDFQYDEENFTVLRIPISKVHSLATLASDVVCSSLCENIRMQITQNVNPKTIPEFIQALLTHE